LNPKKPSKYGAYDIYTLDAYTRKASKNKVIEAKGDADSKEEEPQHVWRRRRGFAKRKEDGLAKGGM
jgi:hypothetical protein